MSHEDSRRCEKRLALPALGHPGLPDSPGSALTGLFLRLRHRLTQSPLRALSAPGGVDEPIDTLLISLPDSEERRRRLFSRLDRESWRLSTVEACCPADRDSLDSGEWQRFHAMSERLRPGQRGCFLSHRRAWKKARENGAGLTVVLEDDVVPLYEKMPPFPALPQDLDVLYLHHFAQRILTAPRLLVHFYFAPIECLIRPFRIFSIDEVLASHCGKLRFGAMPGCAYAVTPKGADKLLHLFDEVGNYDNWDAVVLRHAMSEAVHRRMLPDIRSDAIWFYRGQRPDRAWSRRASLSLNAYAIYPPLFLHDHQAPSVKLGVAQPASAPAGRVGIGCD